MNFGMNAAKNTAENAILTAALEAARKPTKSGLARVAEAAVLWYLHSEPHRYGVRSKFIVDYTTRRVLDLDQGKITRALQRLEKQGLVDRARFGRTAWKAVSPEERRANELHRQQRKADRADAAALVRALKAQLDIDAELGRGDRSVVLHGDAMRALLGHLDCPKKD